MNEWPELKIDVARLRQRDNLAELKKRPQGDSIRPISAEVEAHELEITTSRIPEGARVHVDGVVDTAMAGIELRAKVSSEWEGECRRCLKLITEPLEIDLAVSFLPNLSDDDDSEAYPIDGEVIDVGEVVREELMLALPLSPLCTDGCVGADPERFPTAGAESAGQADDEDENGADSIDPRWAALSELRFDEE